MSQQKFLNDFQPAIFQTLKGYNKERFLADLFAGIIVGIVALPLAIAFGIASGVTPERGMITAIVAGFTVSFLGGSNVQISGPTGALVVIVAGIVHQFGVEGLAIATVLAGIMLIAMGLLKLGNVIKFIPYPIVAGFTAGIALNIFTQQIRDFFGLQFLQTPSAIFERWAAYSENLGSEVERTPPSAFLERLALIFENFHTISWLATAIGVASIVVIYLTPKITKRIPGSFIAIIVITPVVYFMRYHWGIEGIETIGDRFEVSNKLPQIALVGITFESIRILLPSAFTIAMLCAIQSLLTATVADGVTGYKHNSNMELVAQGTANMISPFFGGIPATGAIARTLANVNNGGRTPVAGMVHAVFLLLIFLFFGGLTRHIPMACLAGILIVIAINMSEWRMFLPLMKQSKTSFAVLLTTFLLTLIVNLTVAVGIGMLIAVISFLKRMSDTTQVSVVCDKIDLSKEVESFSGNLENEVLRLPKGVEVYEIEGPLFFGAANKFDDVMRGWLKGLNVKPNVRIIRMRKVPFIDSTGIKNLETLCKNSRKDKIYVILSGVNNDVRASLEKSEVPSIVGEENICANIHLAVKRAVELNEELIRR
jgi:SulP family sulfate permease